MPSVSYPPEIALVQAMRLAFCFSREEIALLLPRASFDAKGRAWETRTRKQQKGAMMWVLGRLYSIKFCDVPLFGADRNARRALILEMCRERTPMLQYSAGWSMHEIMEFLLELKENEAWSRAPVGF